MGNSEVIEREKLKTELLHYGMRWDVYRTRMLSGMCSPSQTLEAAQTLQDETGLEVYVVVHHGGQIEIVAEGELSTEQMRLKIQKAKEKELRKKIKARKKAERAKKAKEDRLRELAKKFGDGRPF